MSACEASMSLLFYFSRGKQYLDVFCCSAKCLITKKRQDQWSLVPNSERYFLPSASVYFL